MGFEPMPGPWKGHVLPLHHTRKDIIVKHYCRGGGI